MYFTILILDHMGLWGYILDDSLPAQCQITGLTVIREWEHNVGKNIWKAWNLTNLLTEALHVLTWCKRWPMWRSVLCQLKHWTKVFLMYHLQRKYQQTALIQMQKFNFHGFYYTLIITMIKGPVYIMNWYRKACVKLNAVQMQQAQSVW